MEFHKGLVKFRNNSWWSTAIVMFVVLVSGSFAALYYRPEYMDGSAFIFHGINTSSAPGFFINHRMLSLVLYSVFELYSYFPATDQVFYWLRRFSNFWFVLVPLFTFAIPFYVLHRQRREYLLPYLYFVFILFTLFGAGFHASMASETIALGLGFWWLYPSESKNLNRFVYFFLLAFAAQSAKGYEPIVILFLAGVARLLFELSKKKISWKDPHVLMYAVASIYGIKIIFDRFYSLQTGSLGAAAKTFEALNSVSAWAFLVILLCGLGFLLLAFGKKRPWEKWVIIGFIFATIICLSLFLQKSEPVGYFHFHAFTRFFKVILFFIFTGLCLWIGKVRFHEKRMSLIYWCLFCTAILFVHDLSATFQYDRFRQERLQKIEASSDGCHVVDKGFFMVTYSLLEQNTFEPKKVLLLCGKGWEVPQGKSCEAVEGAFGGPSLRCLERIGRSPMRVRYDKIVEVTPEPSQ